MGTACVHALSSQQNKLEVLINYLDAMTKYLTKVTRWKVYCDFQLQGIQSITRRGKRRRRKQQPVIAHPQGIRRDEATTHLFLFEPKPNPYNDTIHF